MKVKDHIRARRRCSDTRTKLDSLGDRLTGKRKGSKNARSRRQEMLRFRHGLFFGGASGGGRKTVQIAGIERGL